MSIDRVVLSDSTGAPTSGSVIDNATLQNIYDSIEGWDVNAWTTPALTASTANPTVSSATGHYLKVGQLCAFRANFTISTVGTGSYFCSLPFTATTGVGLITAFAQDISAGGAIYNGRGFIDVGGTPTRFLLLTDDALAAAQWGPTVPFTLAAGDLLSVFGVFFSTT